MPWHINGHSRRLPTEREKRCQAVGTTIGDVFTRRRMKRQPNASVAIGFCSILGNIRRRARTAMPWHINEHSKRLPTEREKLDNTMFQLENASFHTAAHEMAAKRVGRNWALRYFGKISSGTECMPHAWRINRRSGPTSTEREKRCQAVGQALGDIFTWRRMKWRPTRLAAGSFIDNSRV